MIFATVVLAAFSFASADIGASYIEAEGVVYYDKGKNPNAMRRMAILDAYRYLAEEVDAIHVTAESTVRNMRDLDDVINTRVDTLLRGARVQSVTREKDGSFHARVRLPIYGGSQSLSGVVLQEIPVEDFPAPKFVNVRSEMNYTGLVVDCRGLNLSTAIAPAIKSVGGVKVYAYKNIGYENAVSRGMVEYVNKILSANKATNMLASCSVVPVR